MSQRPWLDRYPSGVVHDIDFNSYGSLLEIFKEACQKYSSQIAFKNFGRGMTYKELDEQSESFASFLQNELGLNKGSRIGIQMPNLLQYPVALFGALRAGVEIVNTNPLYTEREMEHQYKDSGVETVVILAQFASKLQNILDRTKIKNVIVAEVGDLLPFPKNKIINFVLRHVQKAIPKYSIKHYSFNKALSLGRAQKFKPVSLKSTDTVFLQYTGGTTGVPKAAMLSHQNMVANCLQMTEWMRPVLKSGEEVVIAALPLYHVFCLTVNCLGLFKEGMTNILITNPRDLKALVKEMNSSQPTVFIAVNTLLSGLLLNSDFKKIKLPRLKVTVAGGMALKTAVSQEWKNSVGSPAIEGYGLTEASPVVSCNPLSGNIKVGTIGLPLPSTQIKLMDESGKDVASGESGELWISGPQVMQGYLNQPEETAKILTPDRWLKTGDMARFDSEGYLQIVDRKKDMILVSGFNVYPNEVEEVMVHHPAVAEVAAVGVEDPHSGEVVKIFVVLRPGKTATVEELRTFAKTQLTSYKVPKHVEFRTDLPKNNVGKILRRMLR